MHESVKRVRPLVKICVRCSAEFLIERRGRKAAGKLYCSRRCQAFERVKRSTVAILAPQECAYIAGLFDGEGSIILYPRRLGGRMQLRCTISNTFEPLMRYLVETVKIGSVVKKVYPPELGYKDAYTWQVYGQNAVALLTQLLPMLIVKRDRAAYAIASQEPSWASTNA